MINGSEVAPACKRTDEKPQTRLLKITRYEFSQVSVLSIMPSKLPFPDGTPYAYSRTVMGRLNALGDGH